MRLCSLDRHEQWVLSNAEYFTAVTFHGRGNYERIECTSIESARQAGLRIRTPHRGVMIYAVYKTHQALIATLEPENPS